MKTANNVVGMSQNTVYEDIRIWLSKNERKSKHTKELYERSIRKFFTYMKDKPIENLNTGDLKFRNADMIRYQEFLQQQYANQTVNSYMASIVSLYKFLEKNEYDVKANIMRVDSLPDDSESYGELNIDEAEKMAELLLGQVKGYEKSMLLKLAQRTSFRKSTLLNLTWDNIRKDENSTAYIIEVVTKGNKKHSRPISQKMYQELTKIKELKYYQRYNDHKIFHLSKTTIQNMMNQLKKEMGFGEDRKITFHSLRNTLANHIMETSDDITEAQEQLGHSDMNTTYQKYVKKNKNYGEMASVRIDEEISDDIFNELSQGELLEIVKATKNGVNYQLKTAAKKIIEERV